MKKIITGLFVFILLSFFAFAQGQPLENKLENKTIQNTLEIKNQQTIQEITQTQNRIQNASISVNGEQLRIQQSANNQLQLQTGNSSAKTKMQITQEQTQTSTKLNVALSNGKNAELKIMPDVASQTAIEKLRVRTCSEANNCTIELKEVGQGEQTKAVYEVKLEKQAKILGLFKTKMQVQTQINAETGDIEQTRKNWWSFLASESDE